MAFAVYGSCGNKDIRDWSPLDITCKQEDVRNQLIPLLPDNNDYRRLAEVQDLARKDDGLRTRIENMPSLLWALDERNALPPRDTDNPSLFRS